MQNQELTSMLVTDKFRFSDAEIFGAEGELRLFHGRYATLSGAYEIAESCRVELDIPRRLGVSLAKLIVYNESFSHIAYECYLPWGSESGGNDIFTCELPLREIGAGLYFARIELDTVIGKAYVLKQLDTFVFSRNADAVAFQLSISKFEYSAPEKKYGGIIYHIFVDRFYKGHKAVKISKGARLMDDWYADIPEYPISPGAYLKNNTFFGGTLYGICEKLEYIRSLGVNTIYLSPIFKAASNHKYDVGDYCEIDEMFGGSDAFKELIAEAQKYGIGIILDGVFNHTGADSVYFNKYNNYPSLGAYQSKNSRYFSWYDFQEYPNKYTAWWGIEILPRINPDIQSCRDFFVAPDGVIEKYARLGIDGFRLDVADELSDEFIAEIKRVLNGVNKGSVLYGEVWEDASNKIAYGRRKTYYLGNELDGVMNYPLRGAVIAFLRDKNVEPMRYYIHDVMNNAPKRIRDAQMNLLGTHDTERIATVLGGEDSAGKSNTYLSTAKMTATEYDKAILLLKSAYSIVATMPGIPSIFYGDETALQGYGDPFNRRTYPWGREDAIILNHYRSVGAIRTKNDVYSDGDFKLLVLNPKLLIFERIKHGTRVLTVVNNSEKSIRLIFNEPALALISKKQTKRVSVAPNSTEIIDAERNRSFNLYCGERT